MKKGSMQAAISQLMSEIQFFLVLKILIREKASLKSCRKLGTDNSPSALVQPYEGFCNISSINAMNEDL